MPITYHNGTLNDHPLSGRIGVEERQNAGKMPASALPRLSCPNSQGRIALSAAYALAREQARSDFSAVDNVATAPATPHTDQNLRTASVAIEGKTHRAARQAQLNTAEAMTRLFDEYAALNEVLKTAKEKSAIWPA